MVKHKIQMLLFLHGKQNTLVSFSPSFPRPSKLFLQLVPLRDLELNRGKIIKTDKNIFTDARPLAHLSPGRADDLLPVVLLPLVAPPSAAEVEATNDLEEKTESKIPSLQLLLHLIYSATKKIDKILYVSGASGSCWCTGPVAELQSLFSPPLHTGATRLFLAKKK